MQPSFLPDHQIMADELQICFSGTSFDSGIELTVLLKQLESLNKLLNYTITELVQTKQIDADFLKYKVYIVIEKGSLIEKIKIDYTKPSHILVLSGLVFPLIITTFTKVIDVAFDSIFPNEEMSAIAGQPEFLKQAAGVIQPVIINGGEVTITNIHNEESTFNQEQAKTITEELTKETKDESQFSKNGEFSEARIGTIRKLDLDAAGNNYFGFNINGGKTRIPTNIEGEFNLNTYRDFIDKPIKLTGIYRYKNDEIVHITIQGIELIETTEQLSIEAVKGL